MPRDVRALRLSTETIGPGHHVHTVGNPGASGALWVYTTGTVRTEVYNFKDFAVNGKNGKNNVEASGFETQSAISPGDSGSPVVNDHGDVVGVNFCISSDVKGVTYCIHVSEVKKLLGNFTGSSVDKYSVAMHLRDQGVTYLHRGEYETAVELLKEAIRIDPSNYVSYNERGAAYTFLDKDPEAIRDFNRSIVLNPKYAVAYRNRGSAYFRLGKFQEAIADFTRALQLNDRYARAYRGRGDVYTKLGKTREAQEDYKKAIELEQASK
jgi:tetratricopeptide (TPR) repeat protein